MNSTESFANTWRRLPTKKRASTERRRRIAIGKPINVTTNQSRDP